MAAAAETVFNGSIDTIAPTSNAAAVTPSDTVDLGYITRALYIGATGDVTVIMRGAQTVTFVGVPTGTVMLIRCSRVKSTGTTATSIVALW